MDTEKTIKEIALLERQLKSAKNETAKTALSKKITRLKNDLEGTHVSATQLANKLLRAKEKVKLLTVTDFNELIRRLSKKDEYKFLKSMSKTEIKDDIARPAKPVGWRFKGKGDYRTPTTKQAAQGRKDGTVYYENRRRRSDVSKVAQLKTGGNISEYLDVYATVPNEDWLKHEKEIMSLSVDGQNYNDNSHRMTKTDDYSIDMRIKKSDLKKLENFTNSIETNEVTESGEHFKTGGNVEFQRQISELSDVQKKELNDMLTDAVTKVNDMDFAGMTKARARAEYKKQMRKAKRAVYKKFGIKYIDIYGTGGTMDSSESGESGTGGTMDSSMKTGGNIGEGGSRMFELTEKAKTKIKKSDPNPFLIWLKQDKDFIESQAMTDTYLSEYGSYADIANLIEWGLLKPYEIQSGAQPIPAQFNSPVDINDTFADENLVSDILYSWDEQSIIEDDLTKFLRIAKQNGGDELMDETIKSIYKAVDKARKY